MHKMYVKYIVIFVSAVGTTVDDLMSCRIIVLRKQIRYGYRKYKSTKKFSVKSNSVYGLKSSILNNFFCRIHAYAYTSISPLETNHIVLQNIIQNI